jgi:protein TonB
MQTLAPARRTLLAASLLFALAGCAHRGRSQPPLADAFFTNPPPQGVLTPAQAGPGDRPPARKAAPASAAPAAPATPARAAGGAAAASAGAAAATAAAAKPSIAPHDTTAASTTAGGNVHVDELPVALTRVPPEYPDAARAAGTQGTVQLQAFVKTDGTVGAVKVSVSVPGLDEAAMACVRQWTFKPGTAGGKPVEAWVGVPIHFVIH